MARRDRSGWLPEKRGRRRHLFWMAFPFTGLLGNRDRGRRIPYKLDRDKGRLIPDSPDRARCIPHKQRNRDSQSKRAISFHLGNLGI